MENLVPVDEPRVFALRIFLWVAIALGGSGCATVGDAQAEARFDELTRLLPATFDGESLWLTDVAHSPPSLTLWDHEKASEPPLRVMFAGRKFEMGDFEGVWVEEWPVGRVPDEPGDELDRVSWRGMEVPRVRYGDPPSYFRLVLDDRFVARATRLSWLEAALVGQGPSAAECAQRLGWSDVRWDRAHVILRRYDPQNQEDWYSPYGLRREEYGNAALEGFHLEVLRGGTEMRMRARSARPELALDYLNWGVFFPWLGTLPDMDDTPLRAELGTGMVTLTGHLPADWGSSLGLLVLFGYNVFI